MTIVQVDKFSPQIIRARYHRAELPEHRGNPLIEALPCIADVTTLIPTFGHFPEVRKNLSQWGRLQMIDLLDQNYLEPLTHHFEVIQQLFIAIPSGYTFRKLGSPDYNKALVKFYRDAKQGELKPLYPWQPTTHPGFSLFGCSGVGKSTIVERALSYFPRAIYHPKYKSTQVVWIKVDCPPDGSMKQFLLSIIQQFDSILGTDYIDHYRRLATDGLILAVGFLSAYHHLGMLVIDEIQHLLDARQKNDEVLLNYLVTLNNAIHIPIVYIGTIRAMALCQSAFRQARRLGTAFVWDRLSKGSDTWMLFLEGLWDYQWCEPIELNEDLSDAMYFHTQGIHALVVRLFQLAQKEAVLNDETITTGLLKRVAHEKFRLLEPMLDSLRHSSADRDFLSQKKAKKYEDLIYNMRMAPAEAVQQSPFPQEQPSNEPEVALSLSALREMGYDKATCEPLVREFFAENPLLDANKAVSYVMSAMEISEEPKVSQTLTREQTVKHSKEMRKKPVNPLQEARLFRKQKLTP